jgi:drug/metabolite transporter (DMT)-like permease
MIAAAGWIFTKSALVGMPPFMFLGIRFTLAASILALLCLPQLKKQNKKAIFQSFSTGILLGLSLLVWIIGLHKIDNVGEGAFIVSLTVVLIPLLAKVFFKDRISISLLVSLVPAVIGLGMLSISGDAKSGFSFCYNQAHIFFLISTLGFAFHVILTARFAQKIPALPLTSIQLFAVGMMGTIATLFTESVPAEISPIIWFWLLCSALISTSLRFTLQNKALTHLNPSHAGMIFMLEPVWTATLGAVLLEERMNGYQLLGCLLIFMALVLYRAPQIFQQRKKSIDTSSTS